VVDLHTKHRLGAFSSDVNPDGNVPPPEDTVFSAGPRSPLVRFGGNVAAIGICAESLREGHPTQAAERGANTYLTSHSAFRSTWDFALPSFEDMPFGIRWQSCSQTTAVKRVDSRLEARAPSAQGENVA
jgi:hypothetical protein